jgi:hypothetical protein
MVGLANEAGPKAIAEVAMVAIRRDLMNIVLFYCFNCGRFSGFSSSRGYKCAQKNYGYVIDC